MHNTHCPCCGHDLYTFTGYYDSGLAQLLWSEWYNEMEPCRIKISTNARNTWLYLFAPDPSAPAFPASYWRKKRKPELQEEYARLMGNPDYLTRDELIQDLVTITADHYWQEDLAFEDSDYVASVVPYYLEIRGSCQGDYAMIAATDDAWFQREFPWLTREHLTELFYEQPWSARISGPEMGEFDFRFEEYLDSYDYWDKEKALDVLTKHHPWLVPWAQENILEDLNYG